MTLPLVCQILRSEAEIDLVHDEWQELYGRASRSPYTDCDWIKIWWNTLGKTSPSHSLHIVIGRRDGKLMAVLPLFVARRRGLRIMHYCGDKAFYYCDMLAETDADALDIWQFTKRSPYYDFADIRCVYPETACNTALKTFAHRRDIIWAFSLDIKWSKAEDWLASLNSKLRSDFMRYIRRLDKKGSWSFEASRGENLPPKIVEDMVRHKIGWSETKSKSGLFDQPNVQAYVQQLAKKALEQKRFAFTWLQCDGVVFAYFLWFIHKGTFFGSIISYDPAWIEFSPGNLVLYRSIQWAIDNGFSNVDIAHGSAYKAKFSNNVRECVEYTFAGSLHGKFIELAFVTIRALWRRVRGTNVDVEEAMKAGERVRKRENENGR